jgi:hypothetical protein
LPCGNVVVTAYWGFDGIPSDLKKLWAELFADTSAKYVAGGQVASKQVEDFRITFNTDAGTDDENFLDSNQRVIRKYSLCTIGDIRHGVVCEPYGRYRI